MTEQKELAIKLDLPKILRIANIGIWRASAFYALAMSFDEKVLRGDGIALEGGLVFQFWKEKQVENAREDIIAGFKSWVAAGCLKELDHFMGLYIDDLLMWAKVINEFGAKIPSSAVVDREHAKDTNVAKKFESCAKIVGLDSSNSNLAGFSKARNSLTHGAGIVRRRDTNNADCSALELRWIRWEMIARRAGEGEYVVVGQLPLDTHELPGQRDAHVELAIKREPYKKEIKLGTSIDLSQRDVAEIAVHYRTWSHALYNKFIEFVEHKGVDLFRD